MRQGKRESRRILILWILEIYGDLCYDVREGDKMILFYEPMPKDTKKIEETVGKSTGIDNPAKIAGYSGAFLFDLPPIYLSPRLSEMFGEKPSISEILSDILKRFRREDYGEVSDVEAENNHDQRWVFNSYADMIGRYRTPVGLLIVELYAEKGIVQLQGENVEI